MGSISRNVPLTIDHNPIHLHFGRGDKSAFTLTNRSVGSEFVFTRFWRNYNFVGGYKRPNESF
jgi:hypothetical protein